MKTLSPLRIKQFLEDTKEKITEMKTKYFEQIWNASCHNRILKLFLKKGQRHFFCIILTCICLRWQGLDGLMLSFAPVFRLWVCEREDAMFYTDTQEGGGARTDGRSLMLAQKLTPLMPPHTRKCTQNAHMQTCINPTDDTARWQVNR